MYFIQLFDISIFIFTINSSIFLKKIQNLLINFRKQQKRKHLLRKKRGYTYYNSHTFRHTPH
jgi:hypothetical protein